MRAFKRFDKRGFTLVELMIVVAIIGVLAALAIYGVRRYLASAKTSEAKSTIGAISAGAAGAYERETAVSEAVGEGAVSATANHSLCGNAVTTPVAVPAGKKYQPVTADGSDFFTGDASNGWKCLRLTMTTPIYYQYSYTKGASAVATAAAATGVACPASGATGFEAGATGDLNGDGVDSFFSRIGTISASNELRLSTNICIGNEFE